MPRTAIVQDGVKFMWDGSLYSSQHEAARIAENYQARGFTTLITEEANGEEGFLVYTRRVPQELPAH